MTVNHNRLLTNLVGIVSLATISLFLTLPSGAKEVLNPYPHIFPEDPYNRSQGIQENPQSTPADKVSQNKKQLAQNRGSGTNSRPSIFNEPTYNRGGRSTPTTPREQRRNTQGKDLLALVESNESFSILNDALKAAGLTKTLQGKDNLTIFAPTNKAFRQLPPEALKALLQPENKEVLLKVITYHVVSGTLLSKDLKSGEVKSVEGGVINIKVDNQIVTVNEAKVVQADIQASNGVIHGIDTVILPPDL